MYSVHNVGCVFSSSTDEVNLMDKVRIFPTIVHIVVTCALLCSVW